MSKCSVVITGTGAIATGGIGSELVWKSVLEGGNDPNIRTYRMGDGTEAQYPVYAAPLICLQDWVQPADYEWLKEEGLHEDPDFALLVAVASMAMDVAGISVSDRNDTALVLGHENLGVNRLIDRILTSPAYANTGSPLQSTDPSGAFAEYRDSFYRLQSFPYLFYLTKLLRIRGLTLVINNACATGLYSLEIASQLIRGGQADTVLVVCSDYAHLTEHLWLEGRRFGSVSQRLKPFDRDRDGSILGDGAAAIVLESGQHANLRSAFVWGSYVGGAFRQDNWHLTLPDVVSHSYSKIIAQAAAILKGQPIDLIVPHGTGNVLWDRFEATELCLAFDEVPPVTAFKGSIGHTLGANALLESVLLLHAMRDGIIPKAANCDWPDPQLGLTIVTSTKTGRLKRVMKTVPAYGGFMAAAVFETV